MKIDPPKGETGPAEDARREMIEAAQPIVAVDDGIGLLVIEPAHFKHDECQQRGCRNRNCKSEITPKRQLRELAPAQRFEKRVGKHESGEDEEDINGELAVVEQ